MATVQVEAKPEQVYRQEIKAGSFNFASDAGKEHGGENDDQEDAIHAAGSAFPSPATGLSRMRASTMLRPSW